MKFPLILLCALFFIIPKVWCQYNGGNSDGFYQILYEGNLNGISNADVYNGGIGDGFSDKIFAGSLKGVNYVGLYSGGSGDGHINTIFHGSLEGVTLSDVFGGGIADGFAEKLFAGSLKNEDIVLPLQLLFFTANLVQNMVLVQWVTQREFDNELFSLQRSADGKNFYTIADIPAALYNYSLTHEYSYADNEPLYGISYYRLLWKNYNESAQFSPIRKIIISKNLLEAIVVYPNPVYENILTIELPKPLSGREAIVSVHDVTGKTYFYSQKKLQQNKLILTLPQLIEGSYFLKIIIGGNTFTSKFIKR